jgi:hypothetical protein
MARINVAGDAAFERNPDLRLDDLDSRVSAAQSCFLLCRNRPEI